MNQFCFSPADILLPDRDELEHGVWSVIACDQFTSEPSYWEEAAALVGDHPSTLHLMLPEVYLDQTAERLPLIHRTMSDYLSSLLHCHPDAMIAVERTQSDGRVRRGLIGCVDLEAYDYAKGATSLIRATEGTVLERIPPRVAIRRGASLELPHVMLLIDDPQKTVLEPLFDPSAAAVRTVAYDTDLMLGGGHLRGTFLTKDQQTAVETSLRALMTPEAMENRYGQSGLAPLLFAVGDGNHSLASAKAAFEEIKATIGPEEAARHPARFALVEIVNLHDDALSFEPIYRVLFHVDPDDVITALRQDAASVRGQAQKQIIHCLTEHGEDTVEFPAPVQQLTVGSLQDFLDRYLAAHPGATVDYIHDEASVRSLIRPDSIGFLFDGMAKDQLFRTVIFDGALPRKTFSMGTARDKRYYTECRKITN